MTKKVVGFYFKVEDRPGVFASLADIPGKQGINIDGCAGITLDSKGGICLVANNPQKATEAFNKAGVKYETKELLEFNLQDKPGELAKIAHALADAKVNINALFTTSRKTVVIAVDKTSEALTVLQKFSA